MPTFAEIKLAIALVALIGAFAGGFSLEHRLAEGKYNALVAAYAKAEADALQKAIDEQKRLDQIAIDAGQQEAAAQARLLAATKSQLAEVRRHVSVVRRCVPYGLVRVLDAAAGGRLADSLPLPAGKSDQSCTSVDWPTLARSVADNYGTARANAEQLNSLIRFYERTRPQ